MRNAFYRIVADRWLAGGIDLYELRFAYERMTGLPVTAADFADRILSAIPR